MPTFDQQYFVDKALSLLDKMESKLKPYYTYTTAEEVLKDVQSVRLLIEVLSTKEKTPQ